MFFLKVEERGHDAIKQGSTSRSLEGEGGRIFKLHINKTNASKASGYSRINPINKISFISIGRSKSWHLNATCK